MLDCISKAAKRCGLADQLVSLMKEDLMDRNEGTNTKNEAWIIIIAVGVSVVVLGALLLFYLTSS